MTQYVAKCPICKGQGYLPPNGDQMLDADCGLCDGDGDLDLTIRKLRARAEAAEVEVERLRKALKELHVAATLDVNTGARGNNWAGYVLRVTTAALAPAPSEESDKA